MSFHNKNVEGRALDSRPGTSRQKPSSIARLDTAAPSGMNSPRPSAIELEASVQAEGDNFNVQCTLGRIALLRNKSGEAYAQSRNAYQRNPNDGEAKLGLARIRADQGKPKVAMQYLQAAVPVDPLNGPAHDRLARLCQTPGLNEEVQELILHYPDIHQPQDRVAEFDRRGNRKPEAQGNLPSEEKQ
jgi:predicted Zn-dependent protease